MTQNDIDAIRGGLANYIGALQGIVDSEGIEKNQFVVGVLVDEIVKTSQTDPKSPYCDPYILVPMFSAMQGVLIQQMQVMQHRMKTEDGDEKEELEHRIVRYKAMNAELDYLMEKSLAEAQEEAHGKKETSNG